MSDRSSHSRPGWGDQRENPPGEYTVYALNSVNLVCKFYIYCFYQTSILKLVMDDRTQNLGGVHTRGQSHPPYLKLSFNTRELEDLVCSYLHNSFLHTHKCQPLLLTFTQTRHKYPQ